MVVVPGRRVSLLVPRADAPTAPHAASYAHNLGSQGGTVREQHNQQQQEVSRRRFLNGPSHRVHVLTMAMLLIVGCWKLVSFEQ